MTEGQWGRDILKTRGKLYLWWVENAGPYRNKKLTMERMAAFTLYLEKGLEAVKRMYPQHVSFVKSHKGKSQAEVKKELLQVQTA